VRHMTTHRSTFPVYNVVDSLRGVVDQLDQALDEDINWFPFHCSATYDPLRHETTIVVKGFTERDE
jgi:hypothetical protein